jgi:integrase
VGFDAGLRWSEVAALTPAVVDLDDRLLTVRQVVEKGGIRPYPQSKKPRDYSHHC